MLLRAFGWRGILRRGAYLARLRSGRLARRLPARNDYEHLAPATWSHRFDLEAIRAGYVASGLADQVRSAVASDADRVLNGELQLYGDAWHPVGWPPRWHRNVFTGHEYPRAHWTQIGVHDPDVGDIKDVWELSRLPFTFLLARAHLLTEDDRYVEQWWRAVEDWASENPPNTGVNWGCGQETSLRAIALCFGMSTFAAHPASSPQRLALANRILTASVERVEPTVGYALSQRNNHAISELVFLLSMATNLDRSLLRLLIEVLEDQFYPDGSYSQQSFTYQRLAVHALQWLLVVRPDLPPGVRSRIVEVLARSRDFLARCSDPVSGWLPNYGPNDGALLFDLSTAHYRDFRPLLSSLGATPCRDKHREPALWLPLPEVTSRRTDVAERPSSYQTLRGPRSLLLLRVGRGRHRPGHSDQQAVDLWIDGTNVVPDPGTYRYTAPAPWGNALAGPEVHALPLAPGESELSLGRFLSEGMTPAELVRRDEGGSTQQMIVTKRPAPGGWLWRAVVRSGDAYTVVDFAEGVGMRVRWNLEKAHGIAVEMATTGGIATHAPQTADPASGWVSDTYGQRRPVEARLLSASSMGVALAHFCRVGEPPPPASSVHRMLAESCPPGALAATVTLDGAEPRIWLAATAPPDPD